jgi:hypothetical protein
MHHSRSTSLALSYETEIMDRVGLSHHDNDGAIIQAHPATAQQAPDKESCRKMEGEFLSGCSVISKVLIIALVDGTAGKQPPWHTTGLARVHWCDRAYANSEVDKGQHC